MKNLLSPEVLARVTKAAAAGRAAWKAGSLVEAEARFLDAWNALPTPKTDQDYAQSLSSGLVIFYRETAQYEKARKWLQTTSEAYGKEPNPYVQFLAGMVAFDSGDLDEAFRLFQLLFSKYRERPFEGSDPKYLAFYRERASSTR